MNQRVSFWVVSALAGMGLLAALANIFDSPTVYAQKPDFSRGMSVVLLGAGGRTIAGPALQKGKPQVPATVWGPSIPAAVCATVQLHATTCPVELRVGDAPTVVVDPAAGSTSGSQCDTDATRVIVECLDVGQDCAYTWRVDTFW